MVCVCARALPPVPKPRVLKEAYDQGEQVEGGGDEKEGDRRPRDVDWKIVGLHRKFIYLRGLVRPFCSDSVDCDRVRIVVTVLRHVLGPPRAVRGHEHHRCVRDEAYQIQYPNPLCRRESPPQTAKELAVSDLVYD